MTKTYNNTQNNNFSNNQNISVGKSFTLLSSINTVNCLEFSNNPYIQIITKSIIYRLGTSKEKIEKILEDPRFKSFDQNFLSSLFNKVEQVIDTRKSKYTLSVEEVNFIKHIALNLINERGKINKNEAFKLIKTKLFLGTSKFDTDIFRILNTVNERNIDLSKIQIPNYMLPKKGIMYLVERNNQFILATGPKFLNVNSHVLFFNMKKIFGIGLIYSIDKEGIISNNYNILPFAIITNDNVIHTDDLHECEYPVKNVPFCVISHEDSEILLKQLSNVHDFISIGARLVGDKLLKKTTNSVLWYDLSLEELLDMFEKRLILKGPPSSGKSVLGIQILRYIAMKNRKVIAIAPNNPNLAKFGLPLKNIGDSNHKWDLDNFSKEYLRKYGDQQINNYSLITLGENDFMPDIETLNKKTTINLINEVTGSVQIKNVVALEMVNRSILEILQMAVNETLLEPDDFQQNQIKTLRRIASILLKWQDVGQKINLRETIYSNDNNSLGFYINSDLFLPELTYILMAEIFFNSSPCFDIKRDGFFLMVDEIPLLASTDGVLIKGKNIGQIFTQINKQGRNMGILLGNIIQDYTSKIQHQFLPQVLEEYCVFHLNVKNKRRIIKRNNELILIPPVTNI